MIRSQCEMKGALIVVFGIILRLVIAGIMSFACSTPLVEYRCTTDVQCTSEQMVGRCESSGHCSFIDPRCPGTGFRYGDSAGSESGMCVAAPNADAGIDPLMPPLARIQLDQCSETHVLADGSSSESFGGATLAAYRWRILSSSGELISTFAGSPDEAVMPDAHLLGGVFQSPEINLTPYHGNFAMQAVVSNQQLTQGFDFSSTAGTEYLLYFAVAKQSDLGNENSVLVSAYIADGLALVQERFEIDDEFRGFSHITTIPLGGDFSNAQLEFEFSEAGTYLLDNIAIVNLGTGEMLTRNFSVETGLDPWELGNYGQLSHFEIPAELRQTGSYTIELIVTDSNDEQSLPASIEVSVPPDC